MAVLKLSKTSKVDLNLIALIVTSILLVISMSLAASIAARCPSRVAFRSAQSGECKNQQSGDGRDKCFQGWCNKESKWHKGEYNCPTSFGELMDHGYDPKYNNKYLSESFPSDLSVVSLGFAAFAMLCICIFAQGLAHIADFVQPGSSGLRLTNQQKFFLRIWLGVSWVVLILTWTLVLAGSVEAQKEWGLYNVPCGVFLSAAVFSALSLVMFAIYNALSLRKGPHLDAGSEPLTPVSGAAQKNKMDPGWRMAGGGDSNHVHSEEQLLDSQSGLYYSPPSHAGGQATGSAGNPAVHVHVAPSYYNGPTYQPAHGGYVSAPGGMPAHDTEGGDMAAAAALRHSGTEPITMTGPMERLRPGAGGRDPLSTEIFPSARPPPPPHLGFASLPPQSAPMVKPGQLTSLTLEELQDATDNFSEEKLLGQGGFGCVYRGQLNDGSLVAVKRLHPNIAAGSSKGSQGAREFQAEVEIISRVHHKNLVKLLGYCITPEEQLLAYEFMPQGSLYEHLHRDKSTDLDWERRQKIAVGSARGLAYLHEDCSPKVIHRDIKASNILLDGHYNAQVADFGLARLIKEENTHITTRVMGTFGYLAPDYAFSGQLNEKSDVYSFGVVLLELITGRKPVNPSAPPGQQSLVQWAWQLEQDGEVDEARIVDPLLEGNYNGAEVNRMWSTAMNCITHMPQRRPSMEKVVQMLLGDHSSNDQETLKPLRNSAKDMEKHRSLMLENETKLSGIAEDVSMGGQSGSMSGMFAGLLTVAKDGNDTSGETEEGKVMLSPGKGSKRMEGNFIGEEKGPVALEGDGLNTQAQDPVKSPSKKWVPFANSPPRSLSGREDSQRTEDEEEAYDSDTGKSLEKARSMSPRTPRKEDHEDESEIYPPQSVILPERFYDAR